MASRKPPRVDPAAPPGWALEFDPQVWVSSDDVPPADWDWARLLPFGLWRAEQRWHAACRRWVAESGFAGSLFTLRQAYAAAGVVRHGAA
jgi:hypothetical protein